MNAKSIIICAVFVSGVALMYDTKEVCLDVADRIDGADVRVINSFDDIK